jgi:hypothetical protein
MLPQDEEAVRFLPGGTARRPDPEGLSGPEAREEHGEPGFFQGLEQETISPEAGNGHGEPVTEEALFRGMGEKIGAIFGEGGEPEILKATDDPAANGLGAESSPPQTEERQGASQELSVLHGLPFFTWPRWCTISKKTECLSPSSPPPEEESSAQGASRGFHPSASKESL